jgi:large subunit ribosomal protein L4
MPISIKTYNQKAEAVGQKTLSEKVFALPANEALIHQAMVAQSANMRQVLADTKDRSEVRGGGKKPWRQKGTGRARVGSNRSPIWRGGGVTFGPTNDRNFKKDMNRKMKQNALCMVISERARTEKLFIVDKLTLDAYRTKDVETMIKGFEKLIDRNTAGETKKQKRSFLIIDASGDDKVKFSARNLAGVKLINSNNINILDLLRYSTLLLTEESADKLEQAYGKKEATKEA